MALFPYLSLPLLVRLVNGKMQPIVYLDDDETDWILLERALRGSLLAGAVRWFSRASLLRAAVDETDTADLPQVFLLDWRLAGDCSEPVIRWIRNSTRLLPRKVVLMTSSKLSPSQTEVVEGLGAVVMEKPFSADQYAKLIALLSAGLNQFEANRGSIVAT